MQQIKRPNHKTRLQGGQAIVLVAVMMVALLGILGLSIDGGGLYFLHRDTQNAVDAALIAALYEKCANSWPVKPSVGLPNYETELARYTVLLEDFHQDIRDQAQLAIQDNGFFDDPSVAGDTNGTTLTVVPDYIPPGLSGYASGEQTSYVRIDLTTSKPSYFIQLVYPSPLQVTSSAVGYCKPSYSTLLPHGMALVSLGPTDCGQNNSFRVRGNSGVFVHNSGIFVNSNDATCALDIGQNTTFESDGPCAVVGDIRTYPNSDYQCGSVPDPVQPLVNTHPLSVIDPPDEACGPAGSGTEFKVQPGQTRTITPGHYSLIDVKGTLNFEKGLYCVDQFTANSGATLNGTGVTFYMPPGPGDWHVNAQSSATMSAPAADTCLDFSGDDPRDTCQWQGLLVWQHITQAEADTPAIVRDFHINGGNETTWTGMIYGPRSECRIEGMGDGIGVTAQVVCWAIDVDGTSQLDISYEEPAFLLTAPRVQLVE